MRCVDEYVRAAAEYPQHLALRLDAVEQSTLLHQGVRASSGLLATYENVVARIEEDDRRAHAGLSQCRHRALELGEEPAGPGVDDDGQPGVGGTFAQQCDRLLQQLRRQVVDHEPTEIFEHLRCRAAPGARHAGDEQYLADGHHASSISPVAVLTEAVVRPPPADASASTTLAAVRSPQPGTSVISSTVACRSRFREPKCFRRAFRRTSPRPGTPSSWLSTINSERRFRWCAIANRCASSRMLWSEYRPSLVRGRMTGSSSSGTQTSSSRLARSHTATSSMPSAFSACLAAATWG